MDRSDFKEEICIRKDLNIVMGLKVMSVRDFQCAGVPATGCVEKR